MNMKYYSQDEGGINCREGDEKWETVMYYGLRRRMEISRTHRVRNEE
jgi:hypothetical protein